MNTIELFAIERIAILKMKIADMQRSAEDGERVSLEEQARYKKQLETARKWGVTF